MAGPDDIAENARSKGVPVALHSDLGTIRTVVEASDAADRSLAEVGNVILATVKGQPVLVVIPGDRSMDGQAVGREYNAEPLQVALASQAEAREITGYDLGLIPPVGHEADCDVLLDRHLLEHDRILFPAGSEEALLELNPEQLTQLDHVQVGVWSRTPPDDG